LITFVTLPSKSTVVFTYTSYWVTSSVFTITLNTLSDFTLICQQSLKSSSDKNLFRIYMELLTSCYSFVYFLIHKIHFCVISWEENIPLIYRMQILIPWLHLSPFHPSLQSYLHTPVTGLQVLCSQLLHVSLQLFPYLPREHANYPKNNTESKHITGKNCCFINKIIISPDDIFVMVC
jgi:hypothetical protein